MELVTVPAQDSKTCRSYSFVLLSAEQERSILNGERPTKVLAVDTLLKTTFSILQVILIGLQSWMLLQIIEHSNRLTRVEIKNEYHSEREGEMVQSLKEINIKQNVVLEGLTSLKGDVERLKTDIKNK